MDKKEKDFQIWIRKMYDKYKSILFIEKHHLKIERDNGFYLASKFNYPYLDAKILYGQEALDDWKNDKDKKDSERRIIHEFCHIITDPFYCKAVTQYVTKSEIEDERERLTDHIAQIVNKHFTKLSK